MNKQLKKSMTLNPLVLLVCGLVLVATSHDLTADQNDPRLDELFSALQSTTNQSAANEITDTIWKIWRQSSNEKVNQLMRQGVIAMSRGRLNAAIRYFDEIIQIAPEFAEGWNKRATVYYFLEQYDKSLVDVRETLLREPRHFGAAAGLGLIFMSLEYYDEALKAFERALEINPHLVGPKKNVELLRKKLEEKTA